MGLDIFNPPRKYYEFDTNVSTSDVTDKRVSGYTYQGTFREFNQELNRFVIEDVGSKSIDGAVNYRSDRDWHYIRCEYDLEGNKVNEVEKFYSYPWHFQGASVSRTSASPLIYKVRNAVGLFVVIIDFFDFYRENVHALIWNFDSNHREIGIQPYQKRWTIDSFAQHFYGVSVTENQIFYRYNGASFGKESFVKHGNHVYTIHYENGVFVPVSSFGSGVYGEGNMPGIARHALTNGGKTFSPNASKFLSFYDTPYDGKTWNVQNLSFGSAFEYYILWTSSSSDNLIYMQRYSSGFTGASLTRTDSGYEQQFIRAAILAVDDSLTGIQKAFDFDRDREEVWTSETNPTPRRQFSAFNENCFMHIRDTNFPGYQEIFQSDISDEFLNRYPIQELEPRPASTITGYQWQTLNFTRSYNSFDELLDDVIATYPDYNITKTIVNDTGYSYNPENTFRGLGTRFYPSILSGNYIEARWLRLACDENIYGYTVTPFNILTFRYSTCPAGTTITESRGQGAYCRWNSGSIETIDGNPYVYPKSAIPVSDEVGASSRFRVPNVYTSREFIIDTMANGDFYAADGLWSCHKLIFYIDSNSYDDPDTIFTYFIGEDKLISHTLLIDPDVTDYHCIDAMLGLHLNDVVLPPTEKYTDVVLTIGFHNGPLDGSKPIDYTHHENVLSTFRTIPNISISNLTMTQSKYPDDGIRIRTIEGDDGRKSIVIDGRYVTDNSLYEFRSVKKNENCETGTVIITDIRTNIPKNLDPYLIERKPNQSVFTVNVEYSKTDTPNCVWSETFNVIQPYIETGQETQEFIRNYLYGEPFTEIEIPAFADSVTQGKTSNNNTTISNPCGCKK